MGLMYIFLQASAGGLANASSYGSLLLVLIILAVVITIILKTRKKNNPSGKMAPLTKNSHYENQTNNVVKNAHLIKLGGIIALISFLFMPVAGCGGMNITGTDLFSMNGVEDSVKIFAGLAMLCALAMIFIPNTILTLASSIVGIISLVLTFMIVKGKMHSGNDFGMSNGVELKSGSYLSILSFIFSAIVSALNKEIFPDQQVNRRPPNQDNPISVNFCRSCGGKVANNNDQFCDKCGSKL
jgi:hypothetical protein